MDRERRSRRRSGPTRNGLLVVAVATVVGIVGWLLGQPELTALAAMGLLAVAVAWAWVRLRPLDVRSSRLVRPARLRVGEEALVTIRLQHRGRGHSPVLRLTDRAGRTGHVTLAVAPIPAGATREVTYRFPAVRRGVHTLGPAVLDVDDPFSLATTRRSDDDRRSVVVLPRTWPLDPLEGTPGGTPTEGSAPVVGRAAAEDEFAALRAYEPGDDVRQVHWRSSARLGRLVVQQYEQPWQRRTTVLLDLRRAAHDDDTLERAVSAAASVVEHAAAHGELIRLVTTDGTDSGVVGAEAEEHLLDELAAVRASGGGSLASVLASLPGGTGSGRLVVCTGNLEASGHDAVTSATRGWDLRVLVACGSCTTSGAADPPLLVEHRGEDLTAAWRRSLVPAGVVTG